jgi:hypothetical protein
VPLDGLGGHDNDEHSLESIWWIDFGRNLCIHLCTSSYSN